MRRSRAGMERAQKKILSNSDNQETFEVNCVNSIVVPVESNEKCNREIRIDCQQLKDYSIEFDQQGLLSTVSSKMTGSTSQKSSKVVVPITSETLLKDQLLIFSVTDEMKKYSDLPRIVTKSDPEEREKQVSGFFANRTRHIVLLIGTLCLMMILSNILILNVTIVCMTSPRAPSSAAEGLITLSTLLTNDSFEAENRTGQLDAQPEFTFSPMVRSSLFATMASGAVLNVPIAVYLVKRLGAYRAFLIAGVLSAISTVFNPMAAHFGVAAFIIARIGQGMPLAFCLPIIGSMTSSWSPVKHNGIFVAIATNFVQLAPVFTMPMAGIVCSSSLGWSMVYYIHAAVTIVLFALWAVFYKDTPQSQPYVSKRELEIITAGKPPKSPDQRVPVMAIFTSPAVWAIWLASFANFAGMQLFVIFMPAYMHTTLGLPLKTASILAALPPLSQLFVKLLAVGLADHFKFISSSLTSKLHLFNSISSLGGGLLLLILAAIPTTNLLLSFVFLISSSSMLGFNTAGVFRSTTLVAKQHAWFVTGVIQFIYCFVLLTIPFAIESLSAMRPDKDWSIVFCTIAFLLIFTNISFCVFGKGSAAPWTNSKLMNRVKPAEVKCF